ncbi:spore coat protein [Candidatus Marinamargulisbacteria bacterium SCGC AG-439-L15]|nr:spore coat protein [Candidatus Marinamargulisbacteria bacterium SCGC AG-439-L15]
MKGRLKGVILAGGTGSRLYPLTKVTNKHLLPVGKEPMIYYPIHRLIEVGITEILIVTGIDHMGSVVSLLGSGKDFGCHFTYRVQDEAGGIAQALHLAKDFANEDPLMVILGDNIFMENLSPYVEKFMAQDSGARLLLKEVKEPERFGVARIEGDKIVEIEEKPDTPKSSHAVTGIYLYDSQVFDFISECHPSNRGELEITDVNNLYIQKDACFFDHMQGWWSDAGTFDSLDHVNALLRENT